MFLNSHLTRSLALTVEPQMGFLGNRTQETGLSCFSTPGTPVSLIPYSFYSLARNALHLLGALITRTGLPESLRWESCELYHRLGQPYETLHRYPETYRAENGTHYEISGRKGLPLRRLRQQISMETLNKRQE